MAKYIEKQVLGAYWEPGRKANVYDEEPTKGPFVAQFHDMPGLVATIRSASGFCIARINGTDGLTRDSNHANAVLLAAAPELLAALDKVLSVTFDRIRDEGHDLDDEEQEVFDAACAAIAKARGED